MVNESPTDPSETITCYLHYSSFICLSVICTKQEPFTGSNIILLKHSSTQSQYWYFTDLDLSRTNRNKNVGSCHIVDAHTKKSCEAKYFKYLYFHINWSCLCCEAWVRYHFTSAYHFCPLTFEWQGIYHISWSYELLSNNVAMTINLGNVCYNLNLGWLVSET